MWENTFPPRSYKRRKVFIESHRHFFLSCSTFPAPLHPPRLLITSRVELSLLTCRQVVCEHVYMHVSLWANVLKCVHVCACVTAFLNSSQSESFLAASDATMFTLQLLYVPLPSSAWSSPVLQGFDGPTNTSLWVSAHWLKGWLNAVCICLCSWFSHQIEAKMIDIWKVERPGSFLSINL